MMELNKIYNEDCLEGMKRIPDGSVDMVLCDLPYGITNNKWDKVIPFNPLWEQYLRVCKPNAAMVLFGQEPFSSKLRLSQESLFRYDFVFVKKCPTGFLDANRKPLRKHEIVSVFYRKLPIYNPQFTQGKPYKRFRKANQSQNYHDYHEHTTINEGKRYPTSVLDQFLSPNLQFAKKKCFNPTQKPVDLCEYLIKTYTNEGELVLDNCMGSGTTAVACINTGRNFIGFETDKGYWEISQQRIVKIQQLNNSTINNDTE